MLTRWLLSLILTVLDSLALGSQHVFTADPTTTSVKNNGVVRRFDIESTLQQVLITAQVRLALLLNHFMECAILIKCLRRNMTLTSGILRHHTSTYSRPLMHLLCLINYKRYRILSHKSRLLSSALFT